MSEVKVAPLPAPNPSHREVINVKNIPHQKAVFIRKTSDRCTATYKWQLDGKVSFQIVCWNGYEWEATDDQCGSTVLDKKTKQFVIQQIERAEEKEATERMKKWQEEDRLKRLSSTSLAS